MQEFARAKNLAPSRRSIIRTTVWAVPAVTVAAAAPAFAASGGTSSEARVTIENGSAVRGQRNGEQMVQWAIPITISNADLTGLTVDFAGCTFNGQSGRVTALTIKMVNDQAQTVGSWNVGSPLSGYGRATFNPGGALPDGPYRILVTWMRNNKSEGSASATFTYPDGTTSVGVSTIASGTIETP